MIGEAVVNHEHAADLARARPPALRVERQLAGARERQLLAIDGECARVEGVDGVDAAHGRGS